MKSVVASTPATPSTISHQVSRANQSPKPRGGRPTEVSTQNANPHHGKAGPAEEGAEPVRGHEGVPGVVAEPADVGLARAQEHAEQPRGEQDDRRGDCVTERQAARVLAQLGIDIHRGPDLALALAHGLTVSRLSIVWWPTPQNSRQMTR